MYKSVGGDFMKE